MTSNAPGFQLNEEDAASGSQRWLFFANLAGFSARVAADDGSGSNSWLSVGRTGTTVNSVALTSTALTWNGDAVASDVNGTFTPGWTGFSANPTCDIQYHKVGPLVTLHATSVCTGSSNATTMTMTGLPVAIRPSSAVEVRCSASNSSQNRTALCVISTGGVVTFHTEDTNGTVFNSAGWANTGTKGPNINWVVVYPLS